MPKVSVAMCSYNHEKYVATAIESVLGQSFADFELVIVDDGSSDKTVQEIEKFSDPRIRLFRFSQNKGAGLAAQRCLEELRGEYIAVLNSDDVFLPGKLERQVSFLEAHPEVAAVFSQAEIIGESGEPLKDKSNFYYAIFEQTNRSRQAWLNHFFYKANCLCHPSVMIRKTVQDEVGAYDPRLLQLADLDFWIRLCKKHEIHILPEKLSGFRVRAGEANTSGAKPVARFRAIVEYIQILKHYAELETVEEFLAVFPECPENLRPSCPELIPVALARMILETGHPLHPSHRYFAMSTLYEQMADPAKVERIGQQTGFQYHQLLSLAGQYDLFNVLPGWETCLFLDCGAGFSEEQCVRLTANFGLHEFQLAFALPQGLKVQKVRWDPVEGKFCDIHMESMQWLLQDGTYKQINWERLLHNGVTQDNGAWRFECNDPMVFLEVPEQALALHCQGTWQFWSAAEMDAYYGQLRQKLQQEEVSWSRRYDEMLIVMEKKSAVLEGCWNEEREKNTLLRQQYEAAIRETEALKNSCSWRITAPLRYWAQKARASWK